MVGGVDGNDVASVVEREEKEKGKGKGGGARHTPLLSNERSGWAVFLSSLSSTNSNVMMAFIREMLSVSPRAHCSFSSHTSALSYERGR